jgi:SAM-dependent methyltransferase
MLKTTLITACPVCASEETRPYCIKHAYGRDWTLRHCRRCGYAFVADRPSLAALTEIYANPDIPSPERVISDAEMEATADAKALVGAIVRYTRKGEHRRSLDVGCGDGHFSYHLHKQGFVPTMMDLEERAIPLANRISGATFHRCLLEDYDGPGDFDLILMSQVLEHSMDPMAWLRIATSLLAPGGLLAVAVPNFSGAYRLLGARDPFFCPPVHLNHFSADSLARAMRSAGLNVVAARSSSQVTMRRGRVSCLIRRVWNVASRVLDPTTKGIILWMFAHKPATGTPHGTPAASR